MLARELLLGFFDLCMRWGLDGVLAALEQAVSPLDLSNRFTLAEHPALSAALVEKLADKAEFDDGGPRNTQLRQLADCVIATLSLTLTDEPDPTVTLADEVRVEVMAALAGPVDQALAVPQIRDTIVTAARARCEERYLPAFEKIAAQLDNRGIRMIRQPKVPLDAVQAVQRALSDAMDEVITRTAQVSIESRTGCPRARRRRRRGPDRPADHPAADPARGRDPAHPRGTGAQIPEAVALSLFDSLSELAYLAWRPVERPVRAYAASQTFAVGDVLDHPKFGRGSVLSSVAQRIEVEFPDGKHTLVHGHTPK